MNDAEQAMLVEATQVMRQLRELVERQSASIDALRTRAEKAEAFKAYVHKRLDDAGVPHDPEPEQTAATGCRIEGRLDAVLATRAIVGARTQKMEEAQRERDNLKEQLILADKHGQQMEDLANQRSVERDEARASAARHLSDLAEANKLAGEAILRAYRLEAALRGAREYVSNAAQRLYDGTQGMEIRAEAKRRLVAIDVALEAKP